MKQFKDSNHESYRVLILSNVGQTGLNLPCASIMAKLVSGIYLITCSHLVR